MGLDNMGLVFWMLSFEPAFSLTYFTFNKRLFGSSSLPAIRVVSSVYLSLLIFLLAILILTCASSSLAFCMMYSAYKLNKYSDSILPWCTPFQIWNQPVVPCPVVTVFFLLLRIRNNRPYAGQEAAVRTGHGTDWFQIGKGVHQGCILSPCLFNLYAEYIMRNAGLEEAQAGIKITRRNINNLRYADHTTLWQKVKKN